MSYLVKDTKKEVPMYLSYLRDRQSLIQLETETLPYISFKKYSLYDAKQAQLNIIFNKLGLMLRQIILLKIIHLFTLVNTFCDLFRHI